MRVVQEVHLSIASIPVVGLRNVIQIDLVRVLTTELVKGDLRGQKDTNRARRGQKRLQLNWC